jgi:hypothetical protein
MTATTPLPADGGFTAPQLPFDPVPVDRDTLRPPGRREPGPRWPRRLLGWVAGLPGRLYWPWGHKHFYRLIGAQPAAISGLAGAYVGGPRQTVLAFRCFCHGADQLRFVTAPARWEVDDLVTPDWPALLSVARAEKLGAMAAVVSVLGDDEVLDPAQPDWRYVASELAAAVRGGDEDAADRALAQYRHASRIAAEADAAEAGAAGGQEKPA